MRDLVWVLALVCLPVAWFNRVLLPGVSGKTLLPFDILYTLEPWRGVRPDVVAYNPLISDLVLENVPWALHMQRAMAAGEFPLWNPDVMSGEPFLAAVLYPPAWLFAALPVEDAFAWFIALHVSLAGIGTYALCRALHVHRAASLLGAVSFMFGGYFITHATFPQVIAAAAWTPLLLAIVTRLTSASQHSVWLWLCGALAVGCQLLAGHVETSVYGLLTVAVYALARMVVLALSGHTHKALGAALSLTALAIFGIALAAVALLPLIDGLQSSARVGARTASDLADYAWPVQQLWTLVLPDLFGNPTHRQWLDLAHLSLQPTASGEPIFWGEKNYVEGGQYQGVLTLLLAGVGLLRGPRLQALAFGGIAAGAMLFVLGSPLFLVFGVLPGGDQLRTPFRWIFPFSLAVSVLAALGCDVLLRRPGPRWLPLGAAAASAIVLVTLALSLAVPEPYMKLAQRFVTDPAWAERVFGPAGFFIPQALPTPAAFWGYESFGLIRFGVVIGAAAVVFASMRGHSHVGVTYGIVLVLADVYSVHGAFFPQVDVALSPLRNRPPVVQTIEQRETTGEPWRFTTFEQGEEKTFLANAGMFYNWQDIRGYDSIIPRRYAAFTERLGLTPDSLMYNRIAPVYDAQVLDSQQLNQLNVRYVLTERTINDPGFREVYRDAHIGAYENLNALPRSFIDGARGTSHVSDYAMNHVELDARADQPAWLILGDSFAPGWRARATDARGISTDLEIMPAFEALRAVWLPAAGEWHVRFAYDPPSFRLGAAISGLALLTLIARAGLALSGLTRRSPEWGSGRSRPNRPLRAPYSPAGRGA